MTTHQGEGPLVTSGMQQAGRATAFKVTEATHDFDGLAAKKWTALNRQRWATLIVVGVLFLALNTAVVGLICFAMRTDTALIQAHIELAAHRMITTTVFSALVAGTVAQTGVIAYSITRFLFPTSEE